MQIHDLPTATAARLDAALQELRKGRVDIEVLRARLEQMYRQSFRSAARAGIADAITAIRTMSGAVDAAELDVVMSSLERRLSVKNLGTTLAGKSTAVVRDVYHSAARGIKSSYKLYVVDHRAIETLARQDLVWIGHHNMTELMPKLRQATEDVLRTGYSRSKLAERLAEDLGGIVDADARYWSDLADHTVSKSREVGRVTGFEAAGIMQVTVYNPSPVSQICKDMNGRTIDVSHLSRQKKQILAATSREEMMESMSWLKSAPAEGSMPSGFGIPPYHYKCKSILKAVVN